MCKMTRMHFKFIADVIATNNHMTDEERKIAAYAFADFLRSTNPNFNRDKFLDACLMEVKE